MAFKNVSNLETPEAEVARLAQAPIGSQNHELSKLPVLRPIVEIGQIIKLPAACSPENETVIITPLTRHASTPAEGELRLRHRANWDCRVIGGDSKKYTPGGWDISLPEAALVRGELITI